MTNVAIIYYSSTGNLHEMALRLEKAAGSEGADVRRRHVTEIAPDAAVDSNPRWREHVYAGFTSSQTAHGGQESTLLSMYHAVAHFGGILVTPGYTDQLKFVDGNPYGVSHVSGAQNDDPIDDGVLDALDHLAARTIAISRRLTAEAA